MAFKIAFSYHLESELQNSPWDTLFTLIGSVIRVANEQECIDYNFDKMENLVVDDPADDTCTEDDKDAKKKDPDWFPDSSGSGSSSSSSYGTSGSCSSAYAESGSIVYSTSVAERS